MEMILSLLMMVLGIAFLVYWIKSLIVMKSEVLFLILGILFAPIIQLIYFFTKRDLMDDDQTTTMKRFLIVSVAYIVVFVFWFISLVSSAAANMPAQ